VGVLTLVEPRAVRWQYCLNPRLVLGILVEPKTVTLWYWLDKRLCRCTQGCVVLMFLDVTVLRFLSSMRDFESYY